MKSFKVEISVRSIFLALLAIGLVLLAVEVKEVLIMLFVAFILNAGFRPLVDALEKRKVPRSLSIFIIYFLVVLVIAVVILVSANEFAVQVQRLIDNLPQILDNFVNSVQTTFPFLADLLPLQDLRAELGTYLAQLASSQFIQDIVTGENVWSVVQQTVGAFGSVAGLLVSLITVIMVSVYMLQRKDKVYEGVVTLLPIKMEKSTRKLLKKVEASLGSWLIGQFLLMMIIGLLTYFILVIPGWLNIPGYTLDQFALPLALIAGVLEALPSVGPVLTSIIAGIIALGTSGIGALIFIIVAFAVIQNVEAIFIVPYIMKKAVGIDPILTILGIIAAFQLGGVVGALLIVPIIAVVQIAVVEVAKEYKKAERQRPKLV